MAKKKPSQAISAKKTLKKVITLQLVKQLADITGKLSSESKDLTKAIEKGAKKLAKKVSKEIKLIKSEAPKTPEVKKVESVVIAATAKPAVKKTASAKATPIKAPVKK